MKLFLDFLPLLLFFIAFKYAGIYIATAVAIAASVIIIAYMRLRGHRIEPMQWLSLGVIVVFGGATLIAQNEAFIKLKPTVLYLLMAGVLFVGQFFFKKNFIKLLIGSQIQLPEFAWRVLCLSWMLFFAVLAAANLWVAHSFDTATWVSFKVFGLLGITLVFFLLQALYMMRHAQEKQP